MAKTKWELPTSDFVAGLCGLFLTMSGVSGINESIRGVSEGWGPRYGIGLVVFGSMIMGVAVNRISNSYRKAQPGKPAKQDGNEGKSRKAYGKNT